MPVKLEGRIKQLYTERYTGFNIAHFTEYLNKEEGIKVSLEKVRQILRGCRIYLRDPTR